MQPSSAALEEIVTALADQTDYEHRWLISPETGDVSCCPRALPDQAGLGGSSEAASH